MRSWRYEKAATRWHGRWWDPVWGRREGGGDGGMGEAKIPGGIPPKPVKKFFSPVAAYWPSKKAM
jgi:hypothetical protein